MKIYQIVCRACKGTGKGPYLVRTSSDTAYVPPSDPSWVSQPCPTCQGSGMENQYIWEPSDFEAVRKILYPDQPAQTD